jgi:hypothetical protein
MGSSGGRSAFGVTLALMTMATVLAIVARVGSTISLGTLVPAPIEGPGVYAIWKIQHGYPAYEWPTRDFFALTLYNFLFYQSYARILAVLGISGIWLPIAAKLLTIPIAAAGAAIQSVTVAGILKRRGAHVSTAVVAALAVCTWFSPGFIGPWAAAARPDVAACVLAIAGFALCVSVVDGRAPARLVVASLLFYLAWAFKQSAVLTLAGVCLHFLVARRSIRDTALVAVPFGLLAAITIAAGSGAYRYNVLVAPRIAQGFEWWTSWYYLRGTLLPNLPVWVAVALASRRALVARRDPGHWPIGRPLASLFAWTIGATFVGGFIFMAKTGSALNHAFEFWIVGALFASLVCVALISSSDTPPGTFAVAAALFVLPLVFAVGHLAGSERIIRVIGLSASVERMRLGSAQEFSIRSALRDRLQELPPPVYIDDEILGQPWNANRDRYPAIVLDHVFYDAARAQGRLEHDGVLSLIESRYFGAVVAFVPPFVEYRTARGAGYVEQARLPWFRETQAVILVRASPPDQIKRPTRRRTP